MSDAAVGTGRGTKLHVALLVAAFFLLQFPQFLTGTQALAIIVGLYGLAFLASPTARIIYGPFAALAALMVASLSWAVYPLMAWEAVGSSVIAMVAGLAVGRTLPVKSIIVITHRTTLVIAVVSIALGVAVRSVGLMSGAEYSGALRGIYIHKNPLAFVVLLGAIAAIFRHYDTGRGQVIRAGSLALYGIILWRAESATVLALLVASIGGYVLYRGWLKTRSGIKVALLHVVAAAVILGYFAAPTILRLVLEALNRDVTLTGRTDIWQAAILAWKDHPLLGVGWGAFSSDPDVSRYQLALYNWVRDTAHSGYVQVLAELGLVGAAFVLFMLVSVLRRAIRAGQLNPTLEYGWLIAIAAAITAHNIVEQSMRGLPLFMLALVYAASTRAIKTRSADELHAVGTGTDGRDVRRVVAGR